MTRIRSAFDASSTAADVVAGMDLSDRTAVVTGGGSGMGIEIVRALAGAGARVIVGDIDGKGAREAAAATLSRYPGARLENRFLDLGDYASVRAFASAVLEEHPRIDILINNAGVMTPPLTRTKQGHELQFGVNFLGHFLLTTLLEPALVASGRARLVSVSSIAHRRSDVDYEDPDFLVQPYDRSVAYSRSKTACALLAVDFNARLQPYGGTANTMNPGGSMTGLMRHLTIEEQRERGFIDEEGRVNPRWRRPDECAATSVWLATAPELEGIGGRYFEECAESGPWTPDDPHRGVQPYALSPENAARLRAMALRMIE
jgi:NAD(P)-dependent dehydrogenase (short-subunit alcohol dehydrogenase family)